MFETTTLGQQGGRGGRPAAAIKLATMLGGGLLGIAAGVSLAEWIALVEIIERIDDGKLLRVLIGEDDEHDGRPLYEAIVLMLRKEGLAGATVLRGTKGFGASSRIHTAPRSQGMSRHRLASVGRVPLHDSASASKS